MPEASAVICCPVTLPLGVSILFSKSHSGHIPSKWNIRRVAKCFHPSPSCDLYLREINAQNWELFISLNSFKVDIVRVESSERWAACVSRSPAQFSHFRWLWTTRRCLWHYNLLHISTYSLFAKLRYWKDSKSKWVIADNWLQTAMSFHENCFSWLSPNNGRLPR